MKISLLCPSRGRPNRFKAMYASACETADGPFGMNVYIDNDDPLRNEYPSWVNIGEPKTLGPAYQYLYDSTFIKSDIIMMCADDLIFRSKGWDTRIKELMPADGIGVISFDDLGTGKRKEDGHPFIGRNLIERVGYLCHPMLDHSCVDTWIVQIARKLDRYFMSDVVIEHLHPKYNKARDDDTYRRNAIGVKAKDGEFFRHVGKKEIEKTVLQIQCHLSAGQ